MELTLSCHTFAFPDDRTPPRFLPLQRVVLFFPPALPLAFHNGTDSHEAKGKPGDDCKQRTASETR